MRNCSNFAEGEVVLAKTRRSWFRTPHLRLFEYQRSVKVRDADALLRRIVINLSITFYHRERSAPHFTSATLEKLGRRGMLVDPTPDPEHALAAEQQLYRVMSLLSAVSPRTCQIFIAQRGGYSYEEVASAFIVKPRTVERHIATAWSTLTEIAPTGLPQAGHSAR